MYSLPRRMVCCLALFLPMVLDAQTPSPIAAPKSTAFSLRGNSGQRKAQSFLLPRIVRGKSAAELRLRGLQQVQAMPRLQTSDQPWQALGPNQIVTYQFGDVT